MVVFFQGICRSLGSSLAEPKSQLEDIFIKGIATTHGVTNVWIGAEDLVSEGQWFWAQSGQPVQGYTGLFLRQWLFVGLPFYN